MGNNKNSNLQGVSEWCTEHWFLTFLLVSSAIGAIGSIASNVGSK